MSRSHRSLQQALLTLKATLSRGTVARLKPSAPRIWEALSRFTFEKDSQNWEILGALPGISDVTLIREKKLQP